MSELKAIRSEEIYDIIEYEDCYRTDDLYYPKSEVDDIISKLEVENKKLKASPEQIMKELFDKVLIYPHEMVRLEDAYKLAVSLKNTKRALWLSRLQSLRNFSVLAYFQMIRAKGKESSMDFNEMAYRIDLARVKCRAKAEEYK